MHLEIVQQLAVIFGVAILSVLALGRLRFPAVVGFLVAGVLVGPGGFGLVNDAHQVELLAELGVALLLFTIGMEFSLERLAHIWRYVVLGGGLQVALTVAGATGAAALLGLTPAQGAFWGYLAALSSTAIVLRGLADRQETAAPHGRFIVGVLIFQDLCIVPMMLTMPMLAGQGGGLLDVAWTLGEAALIVAAVLAISRKVAPPLLHRIARTRNREVFLLAVLVMALGVAWITAHLGLSIALGAFLAGVIIADTEFVHQAVTDVAPFRDVLASLFFVSVGMLLDPAAVLAAPLPVLALFAALLVGKLALAALAALLMRFPARVALLAGAGLAQVGEFSFVLLRGGQDLGLVTESQAGVFLAASVLTMIVAPVLMALSPHVAAGARLLRPLERLLAVRPEQESQEKKEILQDHVIVAGLGLGGRMLIQSLEAAAMPYVALDLNPETIRQERRAGRPVRFGDASSAEVLDHVAEAGRARALVLLLSDADAARRAVTLARRRYPDLAVVVRVQRGEQEEAALRAQGAIVVSEDYEAALEVTERVLRAAGAAGQIVQGIVGALRQAREPDGDRSAPAMALLSALSLDGVRLEPGDKLVGATLLGSGLRAATGATIVAVGRAGVVITNPPADFALEAGDLAFLLGTPEQVRGGKSWIRREALSA